MNISTEEYDKFYEKHQKLVVEKLANAFETESNEESFLMNSSSSLSRYDSSSRTRKLSDVEQKILNHEVILDIWHRNCVFKSKLVFVPTKKLTKHKTSYKQSISELKYEYDLVVQHRKSLEEKLYLYEVDK